MDWFEIASLVLTLGIVVGGVYLRKFYIISSRVKKVLKEVTEVIACIEDAMRDGRINVEEVEKLVKEMRDVYYAVYGFTIDKELGTKVNKK